VSSKPIFEAGTERFVRDWRSTIITVTVRDQRYRQHDPILGVVPLHLSEVLETSSQVTRWYPMDGGIGFGRVRISLLFRSVETKLPPNMLGWDVGTFEFLSERILATGYKGQVKLKMRTGGSTGMIPRQHCHPLEEGDGIYWDVHGGQRDVKLPVKFRYRSPVVFEFHIPNKRGASAYAIIWLHHLIDNEATDINVPIWTASNGDRLTQNYVTEDNLKAKEVPGLEDLKEIGRLHFRGRFKAGTDESHRQFVVDNDSRETFETWEACLAEGVREQKVDEHVPERIQSMHEASLTQGRDVLEQAEAEEKQKWLDKQGNDWSGAFGDNPKAYLDSRGRKIAEPGRDRPPKDPVLPPDDDDDLDDDPSTSDDDDLGITDASNGSGSPSINRARASLESTGSSTSDANKKSEKRKHRGLRQWKPVRNADFAMDEGKMGLRKIKAKLTGGLTGREPDVETEV
jgi:hypothetical protein